MFILNEWVFSDLDGENGISAQEETATFLKTLATTNDAIAVLRPSPWLRKAWGLHKRNDARRRALSQLLQRAILRNQDKCRFVVPGDVLPVPESIEIVTPPEDAYLVQTYLSVGADALITTDEKLQDALAGVPEVNVHLRDDFLSTYGAEMA